MMIDDGDYKKGMPGVNINKSGRFQINYFPTHGRMQINIAVSQVENKGEEGVHKSN